MKPLIYVAHPVSGDPIANAHAAAVWVKWFVLADPSRIYIAPWVAEVLGFGEEKLTPEFYQRVLDDDCDVIRRLDGLVGVGGRWSNGMLQERATARAGFKPVLDWTRFVSPSEMPAGLSMQTGWLRQGWDAALGGATHTSPSVVGPY